MRKILLSKKVVVSLVGLVVTMLVGAGIVGAEHQDTLVAAIVALVGSFNIGQGLADGLSKGQTSASRDGQGGKT